MLREEEQNSSYPVVCHITSFFLGMFAKSTGIVLVDSFILKHSQSFLSGISILTGHLSDRHVTGKILEFVFTWEGVV